MADIFDDVAAKKPQGADDIFSDLANAEPKQPPMTLQGVYETARPDRSLSERAARVGTPSPDVLSLAPKSYDLTSIPRSPFTGDFVPGAPMATEEETRRAGTITATPRGGAAHGTRFETYADIWQRIQRALGAGAPEGSKVAEWTGERGTKDNVRLFAPEQLMTESEQQRHPILTGAGEFAGASIPLPAPTNPVKT